MVGQQLLLVGLEVVVDDVGLGGQAGRDQIEDLGEGVCRDEGSVSGLFGEFRNGVSDSCKEWAQVLAPG